jgi:hypothetical protein
LFLSITEYERKKKKEETSALRFYFSSSRSYLYSMCGTIYSPNRSIERTKDEYMDVREAIKREISGVVYMIEHKKEEERD